MSRGYWGEDHPRDKGRPKSVNGTSVVSRALLRFVVFTEVVPVGLPADGPVIAFRDSGVFFRHQLQLPDLIGARSGPTETMRINSRLFDGGVSAPYGRPVRLRSCIVLITVLRGASKIAPVETQHWGFPGTRKM